MDTLFDQKINALVAFMKYRKISSDLTSRVISYYEYAYSQRQMYPFDNDKLLDDLSSSLKLEMTLQINRVVIDKVPFFRGRDPAFLRAAVMLMKNAIYSPGDYVIIEGDVGNSMFFVRKGILEVLSGDLKIKHSILRAGSFFGEVSLLLSSKRTATIRAKTNCDLFFLDRSDFDTLLLEFPETAAFIKAYSESVCLLLITMFDYRRDIISTKNKNLI